MKISVIICNYNYARFLGDAIESVLTQTYLDYEIIVVDDGSTDDSAGIIQHYEDKSSGKLQAIYQTNQGQAAAFNAGFKAASGEIIAFLDSDDAWMDNKLQRIADTFQNPLIAGVMHQFNQIDAKGDIISPEAIPHKLLSGDLSKFVVSTGGTWHFASTSGLSYRREILEKVFPIDAKKWTLCADGALAYCTAFLGNIETIQEILASYRLHGSNNHFSPEASREKTAKSLDGIEMTNKYLNVFLTRIGLTEQVSLTRNLPYRRSKFYYDATWNLAEAIAIAKLILTWPLYSPRDRAYFLTRFLIKSGRMCIHREYPNARKIGA